MNKESVKSVIKIFYYCKAYIPNSRRLNFSDVKQLFNNHITESEFDNVIDAIFGSPDSATLIEKRKRPFDLLSMIETLIGSIKRDLSPKEKLVFITVLLKLVKVNKQETNLFLDDVLYSIAEAFEYSVEEINSTKKIFFYDEPSESDYSDSLILTNEKPDYIKIIDGLRVVYNPDFKFKIWIKNIKSINHMLFKIIECHDHHSLFGGSNGEIFVYNREVQSLLNSYDLSISKLSSKIVSEKKSIQRVYMEATNRSPRVILNSESNRIEIEGISMTHQPDHFFEPIFYWLEKKKDRVPETMDFHINLTFFNTYASKVILQLLNKLKDLEKLGTEVSYYWYSEEDDTEMKEAGEHYSSIINRDFMYIRTSKDEQAYI
ncbi:MAG: DUF1987 domain-containing protein [Bacteroidota bacterium]